MTLRISPNIASLLVANSSIAAISWSLISTGSIRFPSLSCAHESVQRYLSSLGPVPFAQSGIDLGEEAVDGGVEGIDLDRLLKGGSGCGKIFGRVVKTPQLNIGANRVRIQLLGLFEMGQR